ncbi:hypothetical protein COCNU_11G008640 [Cocos nucifera]|uniref:Uncharacterized protein n=1 Tax=Cocos nucifera TaxID=13894 RepID=A0A8K0IP71_COCNU|nr:hypothetical protein COCNU_11G008640 [Cocos nucifera]
MIILRVISSSYGTGNTASGSPLPPSTSPSFQGPASNINHGPPTTIITHLLCTLGSHHFAPINSLEGVGGRGKGQGRKGEQGEEEEDGFVGELMSSSLLQVKGGIDHFLLFLASFGESSVLVRFHAT